MVTRRNLFASTLAAIAALTVGKAQAEPDDDHVYLWRNSDGGAGELVDMEDLTALYHEHFGHTQVIDIGQSWNPWAQTVRVSDTFGQTLT